MVVGFIELLVYIMKGWCALSLYGEFVKDQRKAKSAVKNYDQLIILLQYYIDNAKEDGKMEAMFADHKDHGLQSCFYHRYKAKAFVWSVSAYQLELVLHRQRPDLFDHPGNIELYVNNLRKV